MKMHIKSVRTALAAVFVGFASSHSPAAPLDPLIGFDGPTSGWVPADPIIAAGPNSLVTMVSGAMAVYNKQGTKLFEQNLGAGGFWWGVGGDQVAEPWVIFDPHSQRFVASGVEYGNGSGFLYLAVSENSNPQSSAAWHKFALPLGDLHLITGEPTFPGSAKVGVDSSALYITAIHYGVNSRSYSHVEVVALDKTPVLNGNEPEFVHTRIFTDLFGPLHPMLVFDPAAPMCFVTQNPSDDTVSIHSLANVLTAPEWGGTTIGVSNFEQPPNVPQPGGSALSSIGSRFMSGVVRNGSLWTAHAIMDPAVDGEAVVRWYQFDVTGLLTGTLLQSGNVDPGPGVHTWLPAINVDADGNMGLVFSIGGASQYASIGYTGRLNDGTALPVRIARAGEGTYTAAAWGEYCGLAIDPDDSTFWLFHQYPAKKKNQPWRTFVGAFQLTAPPPPPPPPGPLHCADLDGTRANSGKNWKATVTVTIHDGNHNAIEGASVSVQWSTGATATGVTDATGKITFTLNSISKQIPAVTLAINNVSYPGLAYSAPDNHDPDNDSNGTSITINKP